MTGILSATPGQGAIRLLVGAHGLLLTQSGLLLYADLLAPVVRPLVLGLTLLVAIAGVAAVIGDRDSDHDHAWRSRHVR